MYDNYHEDWPREDAKAILAKDSGCGSCPDLSACRGEGACIKHLDAHEPAKRGG